MRYALLLLLLVTVSCDNSGSVSDVAESPSLLTLVPPQAAVVGQPFSFDASQSGRTFTDPSGAGLTYTLTITSGANNGLTATGARITGVPTVPGVVRALLSASDAAGRVVRTSVAVVVFAVGLTAPQLPAQPFAYTNVPLPLHFTMSGPGGAVTGTDNSPTNNAITDAGATLGRVLFHDRRLSVNDAISCASCHQQRTGFSDVDRLSRGFQGFQTGRRAMSLVNARYYLRGRFFWDERAPTLEAQVLQPIQDGIEMGLSLEDLEIKLKTTAFYPSLFAAAFGTPEITAERAARALAQFTRSLVSFRSRFDSAFAGTPAPNLSRLTTQEAAGFRLFTDSAVGCARCHSTNAHVAENTFNTGLDAIVIDAGAGNGRFKPPSLRNAAVRVWFMHDGRFSTLEQVIDHYDHGVQNAPGLDPGLRGADGRPRRLNLLPEQKAALIAFLHTLTDHHFLTDPRFTNPFPQ